MVNYPLTSAERKLVAWTGSVITALAMSDLVRMTRTETSP